MALLHQNLWLNCLLQNALIYIYQAQIQRRARAPTKIISNTIFNTVLYILRMLKIYIIVIK